MHHKDMAAFEIRTLSNLVKRMIDKKISGSIEADKSTAMHGWVIGYLYDHRDTEIFQRDLETEFSIRRSTATAILQLLEKKGKITRKPVAYDARLKRLELTPQAIQTHEEIGRNIEIVEEVMKQGITQEELDQFFSIIHRMKKNLE